MRRYPLCVALGLLSIAPAFASAGMLFGDAYGEVRAYSGATPEVPTVVDRRQIESLPFAETSLTISEATVGSVDYQLLTSGDGGAFRWDFTQLHDGAALSFVVVEGSVAFTVDEAMPFTFGGDYGYAGHGTKIAAFHVYPAPIDANPIFEWRNSATGDEPASFDLVGAGDLTPGHEYRFVYRILLDNPTVADAGVASGTFVFLVGDVAPEVQPGDANGDGRVDLVDLNLVRNNFGATGPDVQGDTPPFDDKVDLGDLNAVRNHFGESLSSAVPEPGTLLTTMIGAIAGGTLMSSRRSRHAWGNSGD